MLVYKRLSLVIHACDVGIELRHFNTPLTTPTNLDSRKFPIAHEGIALCSRNIQNLGNIGQGKKPCA